MFVSYTSATGGGVERFSLTPQTPGTLFDSETSAITTLTVANNTAYWATASQVWSDSLADTTGGADKTALPSVPFGGITISDLAVDPATNSYFVGWNAPGFGWFIAEYPLAPAGDFTIFANSTNVVHGLSVVGDKAYWIEGTNIYSQNLDGTGRTLLQSFNLGPVSLNDLAIDTAGNTYLLAASTAELPPLVARYPLTLNASGTLFAFANNTVDALTIAGDRAYWLEGSNVWSEGLNGTGLTLQETLPSGITPTDLAVSLGGPAAVPEPASSLMLAGGLIGIALVMRRRDRSTRR